jgi:pimeloyl-ACP methyl ester carboxylesterase
MIRLAHRDAASISRLVVVDTRLIFPEIDEEEEWFGKQSGRPVPYPDRESILARYRLVPQQPCPAWMLAYMAWGAVRETPDGWYWRFDPRLPPTKVSFETAAALRACTVRVDYIYGERSRSSDTRRLRLIEDAIAPGGRIVVVPEAHHHIMLDQPLDLTQTLRQLLATDL